MERIFHAHGTFTRTTPSGLERTAQRRITCIYTRDGAKITGRIAIYNPNDAETPSSVDVSPRSDGYPVKPRTLIYSRKRGVEAARNSSRTFEVYLPVANLPLYAEKVQILGALRYLTAEQLNFRGFTLSYFW